MDRGHFWSIHTYERRMCLYDMLFIGHRLSVYINKKIFDQVVVLLVRMLQRVKLWIGSPVAEKYMVHQVQRSGLFSYFEFHISWQGSIMASLTLPASVQSTSCKNFTYSINEYLHPLLCRGSWKVASSRVSPKFEIAIERFPMCNKL